MSDTSRQEDEPISIRPVHATVHVATDAEGDKPHPGTAEQPLATLPRTRDLVRTLNSAMTGDIVVLIRGGCYELTQPLVLEPCNSGANGWNVVYRSAPGETVALDRGTR